MAQAIRLVVLLWLAGLMPGACTSSGQERKRVEDERVVEVPEATAAVDRQTGLKPGECWTQQDCLKSGDKINIMCSLGHVGREPPPEPDQCARDGDCTGPRQRCIRIFNHLECTAPGVCEPCCKP